MLGPPGQDLPLGLLQPGLLVRHGLSRLVRVTYAAYWLARGSAPWTGHRPPRPSRLYFTKYQFSGLMLSVGLCGMTPRRLVETSVSE